jgi:hypothetical protein
LLFIVGCTTDMTPSQVSKPSSSPITLPEKPVQSSMVSSNPTTVKATPVQNAKTWIVPDDYKSIADAVQIANTGDIIQIKSGIYSIGSVTVSKAIKIIGDGTALTVLGKAANDILNIDSNDVTIQNLTVRTLTVSKYRFKASNVKLDLFSAYSSGGSLSIDNSELTIMSTNNFNGNVDSCHIANINVKSNVKGNWLGFKNNIFTGALNVIPACGMINNSFKETAKLNIEPASYEIGGVNFEKNNFLGGVSQVKDNSTKGNIIWQMNYWAQWDSVNPVPISGNAKSVDKKPSSKPY